MIVLAAFVIGAIAGGLRARLNKGNRLDIMQYGAIYGIVFAIIAMFLTIFVGRMF